METQRREITAEQPAENPKLAALKRFLEQKIGTPHIALSAEAVCLRAKRDELTIGEVKQIADAMFEAMSAILKKNEKNDVLKNEYRVVSAFLDGVNVGGRDVIRQIKGDRHK